MPVLTDSLAADLIDNSRRWFPELHNRGGIALAVHYSLGLSGELAELGELVDTTSPFPGSDPAAIADELADVTIYALDLTHALGRDVEDLLEQAAGTSPRWEDLVVFAGHVANQVKKLNRGDVIVPETLDDYLGRLLASIETFADALHVDLLDAIACKVAICETRWGGGRRG